MLAALTRNKKRLFWTLQIGGWIAYVIANYLQGSVHGRTLMYILPSIAYGIGGFLITLLLRRVYQQAWNAPPMAIMAVVIISCLLTAAIFSGYRTSMFVLLYIDPTDPWKPESVFDYLKNIALEFYVLFAWSAIYFGIKYYRMVQKQSEALLKANSTAHQAQLKMLRYQLNPHFLFNTLNAISTLVLEQNTHTANQMVTRLSSFLRYTLDRDPKQTLPLKTELDALNLYLTIEKIRFEERLKVEIDIEDQAYQALVPSMILQPLIENAVKYAIAVCEDGGTIRIKGQINGDQLCLTVEDDGPGADVDVLNATSHQNTGVGLANTRERLSVLYGDNQSFTIENTHPHGLAVRVCIPFEKQQ